MVHKEKPVENEIVTVRRDDLEWAYWTLTPVERRLSAKAKRIKAVLDGKDTPERELPQKRAK